MSLPEGQEYSKLLNDAEEIATAIDQPLNTAHLLLACFSSPCKASILLEFYKISQDKLLSLVDDLSPEPKQIMLGIKERIKRTATAAGSNEIDSLHMLVALIRAKDCHGYKVLSKAVPNMAKLLVDSLAYAANGLPAHLQKKLDLQLKENEKMLVSTFATAAPASYEAILSTIPVSEFVRPPQEEHRSHRPIKAKIKPLIAPLPVVPLMPLLSTSQTQSTKVLEPETVSKTSNELALSPKKDFPTLAEVATNLIEEAKQGKIDDAYLRDKEIEQLLDILGKRRSNNPILIGPPGVGKTAIVEGLALKIARGDEDVAHMQDKIIMELQTGALEAGTSLRGSFSERLGKIKEEVAAANGRIIVFIDEIHTLIGAGSSGEGAQDASNDLKTALARGNFPCIGATTEEEYKKYIEKDKALERRFGAIYVEEPKVEIAQAIIEASIHKYDDHHHVHFSQEAIEAACFLSSRYMPERHLPSKAFDLLDEAGSRKRRTKNKEVSRDDIAKLVHERTGVPLQRLLESDQTKLAKAEEYIHSSFVGHTEVVSQVADAVRRGYAGFNSKRPIASMLFIGPTGVGKTELCKALAELLYGRKEAILRFDMTEFTEAHTVSRLIGAPPGYSGSDRGGELTEAMRKRPSQLVLFDEIEKAHRDVQSLLLQILDEGHLTDAKGHTVSFSDTVVILTSNLGFENGIAKSSAAIGFSGGRRSSDDQFSIDEKAVFERARKGMAPELWGRIDERLLFKPLTRDLLAQIASLQLKDAASQLYQEREINLTWEPDVIDYLLDNGGFSPEVGARGMRQAINHHIEDLVAKEVLSGRLPRKSVANIVLDKDNNKLIILRVE